MEGKKNYEGNKEKNFSRIDTHELSRKRPNECLEKWAQFGSYQGKSVRCIGIAEAKKIS